MYNGPLQGPKYNHRLLYAAQSRRYQTGQRIQEKDAYKKREEQEKKEDEGREENKEARSTKNICQRSTSLPHLRLGGL
jgi:hypothetical protein